jgi:beta-lactamase class A
MTSLSRRKILGTAAAAAVAATVAAGTTGGAASASDTTTEGSTPRTAEDVRRIVALAYHAESVRAGGSWNSYVSVAGASEAAVDDGSTAVVQAYSVNKLAVATAILDKLDRGLLALTDTVQVTADIVIPDGDGIFRLDGAYPSTITLGHALAALLTISDDTAVRLCGLFTTSTEINQIIAAKGFPNTQVQPVSNPHRFYLGTTTPRETHDLLGALVAGTLLSSSSTAYLLSLITSPIAFTDGIRRTMSSAERARIATKAGWFDDGRNEAGIIVSTAGEPVLTYSLFAHGQADPDNFGATHPAVQARAVLGQVFLDAIDHVYTTPTGQAHAYAVRPYHPSNGG